VDDQQAEVHDRDRALAHAHLQPRQGVEARGAPAGGVAPDDDQAVGEGRPFLAEHAVGQRARDGGGGHGPDLVLQAAEARVVHPLARAIVDGRGQAGTETDVDLVAAGQDRAEDARHLRDHVAGGLMPVAFSHRMYIAPRAPRDSLTAALALAARAPSAHNTQPWTVRVEGDRVRVLADPGRWLRHGDPAQRDLRLSLGAFVEALRIALASVGLACSDEAAPEAFAALRVHEGAKADGALASLLRQRQTSRLRYSPRTPEPAAVEALAAAARTAGLALHLVARGEPARADWEGWHHAAVREGWLDVRAVRELAGWIRLDPEGLRRPDDGLSTHCLDLGPAEAAALAGLLRPGLWRAAHALYAAPLLAARLATSETRAMIEAPFLGVLVAAGDASEAGAGLLRVWLEATRLGLALAPASVLLDRRGWELGRHLGVAPRRLVLAFRLGRSVPPPYARRRPVPRFAAFA
jgi:hypothetical protein